MTDDGICSEPGCTTPLCESVATFYVLESVKPRSQARLKRTPPGDWALAAAPNIRQRAICCSCNIKRRARLGDGFGGVSAAGPENEAALLRQRCWRIARVCHEVNRQYCEHLGDRSQVAWADAPEWQQESVIAGVKAILEDPSVTPRESHERWRALKESQGWVYGREKMAEMKIHPCMVPYDELDQEQKLKDVIFGAVVRAMM